MLTLPSTSGVASVRSATTPVPDALAVTVPPKLLSNPASATPPAPELNALVPVTANMPPCWMPVAVRLRLPPTVTPGSVMPLLSNCNVRSPPMFNGSALIDAPALVSRTDTSVNVLSPAVASVIDPPPKSFVALASATFTPVAFASTDTGPPAVIAVLAACDTSPFRYRPRPRLPVLTLPSTSGVASVRSATTPAPDALAVTVPPKPLSNPASATPAPPALNVLVPVTSNAPVCWIAPPAVRLRSPEIENPASVSPLMSFNVTSFAETMVTVPPKLLLLFSVTLFAAPAVIDAVPVTTTLPTSVTTPPAVMVRLPDRLLAGNATVPPAAVNVALSAASVVNALAVILRLTPCASSVTLSSAVLAFHCAT